MDFTEKGRVFEYIGSVDVESVSPSVGLVHGGTVISVVSNGLEDGAAAWCKMGSVVVASGKSTSGVVECTAVAGIAGNMTVEVSVNGQEFTEGSGVAVELVTAMNVSGVSQMAVVSGSVVSVYGSGFSASRGVYCAIAGVDSSAPWSYVSGFIMDAGSMACTVPARGAGMQVVEVAMSEGGEMSRSGVQVEYVAAGSVSSVFPASGVVAGGTVVTLVGIWLCGWSYCMQVRVC